MIPESEFKTATELAEVDTRTSAAEQERALIGAVLRGGKNTYEKAREIVKTTDISVIAFSWIWDACERLREQEFSIDPISVGDELDRIGRLAEISANGHFGRMALACIREQGDPRNVATYAETVQDYSANRQGLQAMNKGAQLFLSGRRAKDSLADVYKVLSGITPYSSTDEYTVPIATAAKEAFDLIDRASRGEVIGVKTGLKDLDKLLGCMMKGNMYILAGRPGTGKTAGAVTIALNAARSGKKILIFSLEMSREQIATRFISQISGVDLHRLFLGEIRDEEWPLITNAAEELAKLPITINDVSSISITQIRAKSRKAHAVNGVDLVVVDYLQLSNGEDGVRYDRADLNIGAISKGLKHLAGELKVPILALAQLSRAVEQRADREPVLSDLRESGQLEQDAHAVMFLYKGTDIQTQNVTYLKVAKHRNGPVGTVDLIFRGTTARYEDCATRTVSLSEPVKSWQDRD